MHDFLQIVVLSISISLTATAAAAAISLPAGAALAIVTFRGRRFIIVLINALFGLPPVVVGLVLYLALSRSGPLGSLGLLFTPAAMMIAQTVLAIPIITALVHRASERAWARYGDELTSDGATRSQAAPQIMMIIRAELVTAVGRVRSHLLDAWEATALIESLGYTDARIRRELLSIAVRARQSLLLAAAQTE